MTKADKIRHLYALGWGVNQIAHEVGCSDSYVRVCARQRKGGQASVADIKYSPVHRERMSARQKWRWRNDPEWRAAHMKRTNEDKKKRYHSDPALRAKIAAYRAAYNRARKASQEART